MFHFLIGEYQQSLDMAKKAYAHRKLMDFNVMFYEGLASSALSWTLKSFKRRKCIKRCQKLARSVRNWADRCPENFLNKKLLMDAEIAAIKGKSPLALSLYEESVSTAKHEGFFHEEGIAYERLGQYHLHLGNSSVAAMKFEHARVAFDRWGARIVVDRIDTLIASIKAQ
jgi:histidine kinase